MKSLYIIIFLSSKIIFCQEGSFNLIIFLNDELIVNTYDFNIHLTNGEKINANYIVGDLSFDLDKKSEIFRENQIISFSFSVLKATDFGSDYDYYNVSFENYFLNKEYLILKLYDLKSRKFKKKLKKKNLKYDFNLYTQNLAKLNI